ncbi:MAG: L-histidine N(alpha)-methyltransferase [Chloroflexi bacterium]|nr:L-histidine N(alpha)-methyltransferase [Chloroflexota bacterium]
MTDLVNPVRLLDLEPRLDTFREEVLDGLWRSPKRLPCKFFYDDRGSQLFDAICELDEYYPTRTELDILHRHVGAMAAAIGPRCRVVEYGSGSGVKTRILLDALEEPVAYVPIDISREHLLRSARRLAAAYPDLEVLPVCADYTQSFDLPDSTRLARRTVVYFPGSTIGNFDLDEAREFLRHIGAICGPGGGLLIGVDLKKDPTILHAAYNDAQGVTAAFNLNLLARINRELGADLRLDHFAHYAFYSPEPGRIEMHLVSLSDQTAEVGGEAIAFEHGESILTEYSYKYSLGGFRRLAADASFDVQDVWVDDHHRFSVQYLTVR